MMTLSTSKSKIAIVGSPNVGKSVLFGTLTKSYVTVSNYPGTTVEISTGTGKINEEEYEIIDTPGLYNLLSITEEEKVSRRVILETKLDLLLHVIDAKSLERMLNLTLQLIETGIPVILVCNMLDEAKRNGLELDLPLLAERLGIAVVGTVLTEGRGVEEVRRAIAQRKPADLALPAGAFVEPQQRIVALMSADYAVAKPVIAGLLLQGDLEMTEIVKGGEPRGAAEITAIVQEVQRNAAAPIQYTMTVERHRWIKDLVAQVTAHSGSGRNWWGILSRWTMRPLTGIPILLAILYFGVYQFVGGFGAGTLVDFLENTIFLEVIVPPIQKVVLATVSWHAVQELIVGEYGLITLAVRYAIAVIMPIVATFFLAFAVIEDSGYLPRLAMLLDRIFKKIGLSGRAVIPMVLGLGCDTMATIVTRTLPTRRERVISTLLLSLAVPCSAQLGVILGILTVSSAAFGIWLGVIAGVFMWIGWLAAKVMPGEKAIFFMEIPPLRMPKLKNVAIKTAARMQWYFKEVFPVFIIASLLLWFLQESGAIVYILKLLQKPVAWLGLPAEGATIFLYGFFRRDYGAAGLYDLVQAGRLTMIQVVVAAVTLTLFLPCIAQFLINIKERGLKVGLSMSAFVFAFAYLIGVGLNHVLNWVNII